MQFERTQPIHYPPEQFEFTGSGGEYFRIWIVNLFLTVLTLGIYSAWAKVRRLQYFYRNTRLAGSVFDYHGDPVAILKGRVIAFALLIAYSLAKETPGWPLLLALVLIGGLLPWLLRNSFRFRLRNSSYRGLRFSFRGTTKDAYVTFLGFGLFAFFTLYLAAPLFHQRLKRYQHGQSWFGRTAFQFNVGVGRFYLEYLLVLAVLIGGFVAAGILFAGSIGALSQMGNRPDPAVLAPLLLGFFALLIALSLIVGPLFQARIGNLVWNGTRLGENRFESRLEVGRLFFIQLTNFILVVLSLGLYIPWAAVRVARYRAECMSFLPQIPVEAFVAETSEEIGATGEETAEMFDIDIGL